MSSGACYIKKWFIFIHPLQRNMGEMEPELAKGTPLVITFLGLFATLLSIQIMSDSYNKSTLSLILYIIWFLLILFRNQLALFMPARCPRRPAVVSTVASALPQPKAVGRCHVTVLGSPHCNQCRRVLPRLQIYPSTCSSCPATSSVLLCVMAFVPWLCAPCSSDSWWWQHVFMPLWHYTQRIRCSICIEKCCCQHAGNLFRTDALL